MKLLVTLCVLVSVTYASEITTYVKKFKEEVLQVGTECAEKVNATGDDIEQLMRHEIPKNHEGKCLLLCIDKHFNILSPEGTIDEELMKTAVAPLKVLDKEMYDKCMKLIDICVKKVTDDPDPCITASNIWKCSLEEQNAIGLQGNMFT